MTDYNLQQGVGIVEVMIALVLIMISAMAVGNMLATSMASAQVSSVHFSVDSLSNQMLATLRSQSVDAQSGSFDFDGATDETEAVFPEVSSWNDRIKKSIPQGIGSISCDSSSCDVAISWYENIDGASHRQVYRTRTPL